jgi:hypothetical protein
MKSTEDLMKISRHVDNMLNAQTAEEVYKS